MRIPAYGLAIFAVVTCHALPAAAQVDQQRAQEYFKEAQALCEHLRRFHHQHRRSPEQAHLGYSRRAGPC